MHKAAPLVIIAAFTLHAADARGDIRAISGIPDAYWGKWAPNAESCKEGDAEAIVLSGKAYAGPLGTCEVTSVTETASPKGSIYSARLLCSSSGKNKTATYLIIRPGDANQISLGPQFTSVKPYQRCSENTPASK